MAGQLQLQQTLSQPYDRPTFVRDVLGQIFDGRLTVYSPALVPANLTETERRLLRSVEHFADLTLDDGTAVRCFDILLQTNVRIEQNRVGIQQYVRKLLLAGDAVLVNFLPTQPNGQVDPDRAWRLTLVAKDTVNVDGEIKDRPTNAKRYTYLLGRGQACRTPAERLVALFGKTTLDFAALVRAFEVETLSKAFFNEYKRHYLALTDYLLKSNFSRSVFNGDEKAIRDWAKKLLGRVVFLYFVQKKGWLGASTTDYADGNSRYDQNFLTDLFHQSGANDAFYPNWLSPLFFETLNQARPNDEFTMPNGSTVKVPFLNGGLFDRDAPDHRGPITLPATLFHQAQNPDDPARRGFFDFLNAYNFTVQEDSPDDHIVAVDPEMLGNIFENLLEDNKDKGAFYTPKAIVHYMCRQSLIEYLDTALNQPGHRADLEAFVTDKLPNDFVNQHAQTLVKLLDTVKICDPAIGSGAFPMGLLQEIYLCKLALTELAPAPVQDGALHAQIKLDIIQNSIYGVDIERGAVDIARLRFWLSLVVDETHPRPLPNLDYKIVVGNSLVSKLGDDVLTLDWSLRGVTTSEQELVRLIRTLGQRQRTFFSVDHDKVTLQREIRDLKIDLLLAQIALDRAKVLANMPGAGLFALSAKDQKKAIAGQEALRGLDTTTAQLRALRQHPDRALPYFDWRLDFADVLNPHVTDKPGFDIVIGNPPYIRAEELGDLRDHLKSNYTVFTSSGDIFSYFYEQSYKILIDQGVFCFINNTFDKTTAGEALREYVKNNFTIKRYVDFTSVKVFDTATTYPVIITAQRSIFSDTEFKYLKVNANLFDKHRWAYEEVEITNVKQAILQPSGWTFKDKAGQQVSEKIISYSKLVDIYGKCYYGVKTALNEAFVFEILFNFSKVLKPVYDGKDLKKWQAPKPTKQIIIFKSKSTKTQFGNLPESEAFDKIKSNYPALAAHLLPGVIQNYSQPKPTQVTGLKLSQLLTLK